MASKQAKKNLIKLKDFNPEYVTLGEPSDNGHGGTKIPMRYNCPKRGEIPLTILMPKLDFPFGASRLERDGKVSYSVAFSYTGFKNNFEGRADEKMVFEKMKGLERRRNELLAKSSKKYLKKKKSLEAVEGSSNPIVKHSLDKKTGEEDKHDPTTSCKLYSKDHKEFHNVYVFESSNKKQRVPLTVENLSSVVPSRSSGNLMVSCHNTTVVNGIASSPLYCNQIMVFPSEGTIEDNVFDDDDSDDNAFGSDSEDEEEVKVAPTKANGKDKKEEESEVDEESEEEVEVEVEDSDED